MLLARFIDPWLRRWVSFPAQMLAGNLVCVSLLTCPVMPWLNKHFGRWLKPVATTLRKNVSGAILIAALLLLWLALFLVIRPET